MKTIYLLLAILFLFAGCGNAQIQKVDREELRKLPRQVSVSFDENDLVPPSKDVNNDRKTTFTFIDSKDDIPGNAIVDEACIKNKNVICYKQVYYRPIGYNRQLNEVGNQGKRLEKQTLGFQQDTTGSQNYCFRVVMFNKEVAYNDYVAAFKPGNPPKNHSLKNEQWLMSGCEVTQRNRTRKCNATEWPDRTISPFITKIGNKYRRRYVEDFNDVQFFVTSNDIANLPENAFWYVIEGIPKVQKDAELACPTASTSADIFPTRMSGDPRIEIIRR